MTKCIVHSWCKDKKIFYCETCGEISTTRPETYESNVEELSETEVEKCKHVWECLRDRCHNRGKGKYQAYKCKLCGKFQRR